MSAKPKNKLLMSEADLGEIEARANDWDLALGDVRRLLDDYRLTRDALRKIATASLPGSDSCMLAGTLIGVPESVEQRREWRMLLPDWRERLPKWMR